MLAEFQGYQASVTEYMVPLTTFFRLKVHLVICQMIVCLETNDEIGAELETSNIDFRSCSLFSAAAYVLLLVLLVMVFV